MKRAMLIFCLPVLFITNPATAQPLAIPNVFANGAVASATEVNANFDAVADTFNAYLYWDMAHFNYAAGDGLRSAVFEAPADSGYQNPGRYNTALGDGALLSNTLGKDNTAIGYNALTAATANVSGCEEGQIETCTVTASEENTVVGARALASAVAPRKHVAVGVDSLALGTSGFETVAVGHSALKRADYVSRSTALGANAAQELYNAIHVTALGAEAMYNSDCADFNVAVGFGALNNIGNINGLLQQEDCTGLSYGYAVTTRRWG